VAHDSHNLIVCGMDDADMALAASKVARLGGGFVVAAGGEVLAELALPIAGLMSGAPLPQVLAGYEELTRAWKALGVPEAAGNPIMHLSFLAPAGHPPPEADRQGAGGRGRLRLHRALGLGKEAVKGDLM